MKKKTTIPTTTTSFEDVAKLHTTARRAEVLARHGTAVDRGLRSKIRWEARAEPAFQSVLGTMPSDAVIEELAFLATKDWGTLSKGITEWVKHFNDLGVRLHALFSSTSAAEAVYMSLAHDISEDAGQATLDTLGIDKTFLWTNPREMNRDVFSVRGSKIIQLAYGNHINELQKMIVRATDPAHPKTQSQVKAEIKKEWPRITNYDAKRIARTEVASMWETTNFNVQLNNGVTEFDWLIAKGPLIGPPNSEDVCKICLAKTAEGPYNARDLPLPPAHPLCRCTTIPRLGKVWLPPAEPWLGEPNPPLPLVNAPIP